jgi:glycerophosphoryl diester phosphodiesterase
MKLRTIPIPLFIAIMNSFSAFAAEIIAHRGASADAPENTLAAFHLAWEQKADAIELDVYATRDGKIAVIHDPNTKRTTGLNRKVDAQTMDELRKLDAGAWKADRWKGERIPSLDEVLAVMPAGKRVFVEIKCGPEILPELARVVAASPCKPNQVAIIGFGHETMKQAKALLPEHEVSWVVKPEKNSAGRKPSVEELIQKARDAGLDGLDLDQSFPIDAAFASKVREAKLKLYVWTVDSPKTAKALVAAGVDGITTNRPGLLRE